MTASPVPTTDFSIVSLTNIQAQPGFNPRRYFDNNDLSSLTASIQREGVLQPIVIRPRSDKPGHFWIVAGERRYRASINAGLSNIPALVRSLSDADAKAIAIIENYEREDVAPSEEARVAAEIVSLHSGDRSEAAQRLGWNLSYLNARLLLNHASEDVLAALDGRQIKLGHAERLATLTPTLQDTTLKSIIANGITVKDLDARLGGFAQTLADAIFDVNGCEGCTYNTTQAADLFDTGLETGRCTDPSCFGKKTRAALDAIIEQLKEEYSAVFLDLDKTQNSFTVVLKQGEEGVGNAQFSSCQGCNDFGARVSSAPGLEGVTTTDCCFNLSCHRKKVTAYQTVKRAASTSVECTSSSPATSATARLETTAVTKLSATTPTKVITCVDSFLRAQAAEIVGSNARMLTVYGIYALSQDSALSLFKAADLLGMNPPSSLSDRASAIGYLYGLDEKAHAALANKLAMNVCAKDTVAPGPGNAINRASVATIEAIGRTLPGHFVLDAAFLEAHTKGGIQTLLNEARTTDGKSFPDWYNATKKDDKAFGKIANKGKADFIKAILASGFDFSMFVPDCVGERMQSARRDA